MYHTENEPNTEYRLNYDWMCTCVSAVSCMLMLIWVTGTPVSWQIKITEHSYKQCINILYKYRTINQSLNSGHQAHTMFISLIPWLQIILEQDLSSLPLPSSVKSGVVFSDRPRAFWILDFYPYNYPGEFISPIFPAYLSLTHISQFLKEE